MSKSSLHHRIFHFVPALGVDDNSTTIATISQQNAVFVPLINKYEQKRTCRITRTYASKTTERSYNSLHIVTYGELAFIFNWVQLIYRSYNNKSNEIKHLRVCLLIMITGVRPSRPAHGGGSGAEAPNQEEPALAPKGTYRGGSL